jgi:hypothetical protein
MKAANIAPAFACMYPGLCDVAQKHGYALAIHGSVVTDLDLIACPWTERAVDAASLKDALMQHMSACGYGDLLRGQGLSEPTVQDIVSRKENRQADEAERKPHGRLANRRGLRWEDIPRIHHLRVSINPMCRDTQT